MLKLKEYSILEVIIFCFDIALMANHAVIIKNAWYLTTVDYGDILMLCLFVCLSVGILSTTILSDLKQPTNLRAYILVMVIVKLGIVFVFYFIFGLLFFNGNHLYRSHFDSYPSVYYSSVVFNVFDIFPTARYMFILYNAIKEKNIPITN